MSRRKDAHWSINETPLTWDEVQVALLMDLRDELKELNRLLRCPNFQDIPHKLERIARNTSKPRKRRKA